MPLPKRKYHKRGQLVDGYEITKHPLYRTYNSMMRRCYVESEPAYENYGGRGIGVHPDWFSFANFAADMGMKPARHYTLERVDNDADYNKWNCRWATRTEQCLNRRVFKNNKVGVTGVRKLKRGSYMATYCYEGVKYRIGIFKTKEDAVDARAGFEKLFSTDRERALSLVPDRVTNMNSSTGHRGVTKTSDGGYIVRTTVNGVRTYLGYFKTVEEAVDAKRRANQG